MEYDLIVVGGGLAGASLAIGAAGRGMTVLVLEKRTLPAHKLCGEFLSTEVRRTLVGLGVMDDVAAAGAVPIRRAVLSAPHGAPFETKLPGEALGLSRYALDALLLRRAQQAGALVRQGVAASSIDGSLGAGFVVRTAGEAFRGRMAVAAYGRRTTLDRKLGRNHIHRTAPFVAFKAHHAGIGVDACVELHLFPGGYCGLSPVEDGRTNVCWMADAALLRAAGGKAEAMLDAIAERNAHLGLRMTGARRLEPFLAVSQISLVVKGTWAGDLAMIGDAAAMIAPLAGDGMAMALRSGEMMAPLADAFVTGTIEAPELKAAYTAQWRREFMPRLRVARALQRAAVLPALPAVVLGAFRHAPALGRWLVRHTRGDVPTATTTAGRAQP